VLSLEKRIQASTDQMKSQASALSAALAQRDEFALEAGTANKMRFHAEEVLRGHGLYSERLRGVLNQTRCTSMRRHQTWRKRRLEVLK
jgi:hypothetical protein